MAIVTLTTDIGNQDYLVGAVKGKLLQANKQFNIIDITHHLSPFNYPQAAYVAGHAIENFPSGSFHIVLVNLFDNKPEHMLLAYHNDQYIACADNGLLTMILEDEPQMVVALPMDGTRQKNTLYCTEVIANAFEELIKGKDFKSIGKPVDIQIKRSFKPKLGPDYIEGHIIFIDSFENVVVNITREDFESQRMQRNFRIVFKRDEVIEKISESYADVAEGEKLAFFNSAGYLEIAINKGNAAGLLGLQGFSERQSQYAQQPFSQKNLFYQTVKILFGE